MDAAEWERLPVQRQVWLVCSDEAARKSRHWFDVIIRVGRAGMGVRTAGLGTDMVNADRAARLSAMQFAASDLIPRLTEQEVAELRANRALPQWFVPEMVRLSKTIERELRRAR